MGVNATFYLRRRRLVDRDTVSIPIDAILRVEGCSAVACYVVVKNDKPAGATFLPSEATRHLVVGTRAFVITYIKYLAMKHGVPVRLNLGL